MTPVDLVAGVPRPDVDLAGSVSRTLQAVDLDAGLTAADVPAVLRALGGRTGLVVGVALRPLSPATRAVAEALDLTLVPPGAGPPWAVAVPDPAAALEGLAARVAAAPRAALVLAAVLRATALLPLAEGLAAEASAYSTLLAGPEHRAWLANRGPGRPPELSRERVRLVREGDLLTVRLARPARRNAVDAAMREGLLDEFGSAPDPATAWLVRVTRSPGRSIAALGDRLAAHVHGPCAGAGIEVPAFAARFTADPGATFRLPELTLGLLPGAGGTVSMTRRAGRWRTLWMALSGEAVDAPTALAWGLVDELQER